MIVSIQYLRGIAALLVLLAHISYKDIQYSLGIFHFDIGIFGVDIFFIISGFIMYQVSYNSPNTLYSVYSFLKHRIIRIMPLYWVLSIIALVLYIIAPNKVNSSTGATDVINSFTLFPSETRYLVSVGWTLSYEFYFYILFSISLYFRQYRAFIICSFLVGLFFIGSLINKKNFYIDFLTNSLLLEFVYGVIIAKLYQNYNKFTRMHITIIAFGLLIICMLCNTTVLFQIPEIRGICLGLPAMLLVFVFVMIEKKLKKHEIHILKEFGNMSYSLYLIHLFVLAFVAIIYKYININTYIAEWIYIFCMFSMSLISGYFVYIFWEKPLLALMRRNL